MVGRTVLGVLGACFAFGLVGCGPVANVSSSGGGPVPASGALVTLDPATGAVIRKLTLDDDLHDVLVVGDLLYVTRFRSAELLVLKTTGEKAAQSTLEGNGFNNFSGPPTLAYRAIATSDGTVVIVHQQSTDRTLGTGLGAYYGGNCGGSVADTYISTARSPNAGGSVSPFLDITSPPRPGPSRPLDVARP